MTLNTEVLVHVAAPSGARDDARYRALVESCLAFEPVSRLRVYSDADDLDVTVEDLTSSLASSAGQSLPLPEIINDDTSFNSGDELNSLLEPHYPAATSRDDALARISSQQPGGFVAHVPSTPIRYQSTEEEDSELSCRAPIPLGRQDSTDQTHSQSSERGTGPSSTAVKHSNKPTSSQATQAGISESLTWGTPLDTIPDSQPRTSPPRGDHDNDQTAIDNVQVDRSYVPDTVRQSKHFRLEGTSRDPSPDTSETRVLSSMPSPGSPSKSLPPAKASTAQPAETFTKPVGKRKKAKNNDYQKDSSHSDNHASVETPIEAASSFASDQQNPKRRQILPQTREIISLDDIPLEIRGPNPEVSNEKFRTHVTPTLQALADRMKLASRFSPSQQTRALHPLERGYWFIQNITIKQDTDESEIQPQSTTNPTLQIWTLSFFSQFWCFLRDFLIEGRAGWGVWCLVEESSSPDPNRQTADSLDSVEERSPSSSKAKSVNLKIYTWGEVAPHIYMLLFLATERRVRKLQGVEWRDARDKTVIKM
ncbi:uncharacterized protein TRUGW13939_02327 [Talaromyces rugulosus]|uniref:Uncharacterized protein n=1 Tax=Talaromyces rugulosus TaxID=121627 RepID=A0A7H8QP51_TALRU|nr:uncharacterized protein TRUGW13939_02327 [Talaromyces rugulosus]QKX55235.1 hypothetical protein TRUGW13939_02327 [Talaromyces rugulosus]